jgi:hypothetical protein
MRRTKISATTAAKVWKRDNQNVAMMLRTIPAERTLQVKYEAVCENPGRELQRVCDFLGLAFEPGMVTLWQRPVHNIPGNPMLFNRTQRSIVHDERWRRDLTEADLTAIDRLAGPLNRSFGYR